MYRFIFITSGTLNQICSFLHRFFLSFSYFTDGIKHRVLFAARGIGIVLYRIPVKDNDIISTFVYS